MVSEKVLGGGIVSKKVATWLAGAVVAIFVLGEAAFVVAFYTVYTRAGKGPVTDETAYALMGLGMGCVFWIPFVASLVYAVIGILKPQR